MGIKVKLIDVIIGMQSQTDELSSYLNKETGDVVGISDYQYSVAENDEALEDGPDWERELVAIAREIISTDKYIQLPSKYEIDEYHLMEEFAESIDNPDISQVIIGAMKGKGAFRRFKDTVNRLGIMDDWHKFRDNAVRELAIEWCHDNQIEFAE